MGLIVCECPGYDDQGDPDEEGVEGWEERVPLLNGTVRFGAAGEERGWAGRSVSCRRIAERWFVFTDGLGEG